jgi:hypothetical protein
MKVRILLAVVLVGLTLTSSASAWYPRGYRYGYGGGYRNYNYFNGGYYHGGAAGYNAYTGRYGASRSFYNPYTGRYGNAQVGYNPYTNRYAYRYGYGH